MFECAFLCGKKSSEESKVDSRAYIAIDDLLTIDMTF